MFYQFDRLGTELTTEWPRSGGGIVLRISENARKCVVFFGIGGAGPMDNAGVPLTISYGGNGFLIAHHQDGVNVPYLITCRHVGKLLSKHSEFYVRGNTIWGEAYTLPDKRMEWAYHPDQTLNLPPPLTVYQLIYLTLSTFWSDAQTTVLGDKAKSLVYCGEPISLIGLFRLYPG